MHIREQDFSPWEDEYPFGQAVAVAANTFLPCVGSDDMVSSVQVERIAY